MNYVNIMHYICVCVCIRHCALAFMSKSKTRNSRLISIVHK